MASDAFNISPQSPIQNYTGTFYVNKPTQVNKLFLQFSDSSQFYFAIIRKEGNRYKFINSGILNGYYDSTTAYYLYKIDFDNYIRFPKVQQTVVYEDPYYVYLNGNNVCDLTLATGNDIIASNLDKVVIESNGDVYIAGNYTPSDLNASIYRYYFQDRIDSTSYYRPPKIYKNTWYPITLYGGVPLYFSLWDKFGVRITNSIEIRVGSGYEYKVGLIYISPYVHEVRISYDANDLSFITNDVCGNPYYFYGKDGAFDLIYCEGKKNEIDNVSKDNTKIGDSILITKQLTNKQIKQNTGLNVSDYQIRNLLSSQFVYEYDTFTTIFKPYLIDTQTFEGFNGVSFGNRNIELLFTDPKEYKRITSKTINFYD